MADKITVTYDKAAVERLKGLLGNLGPEVILQSMARTQRKQMKRIVEVAKAKSPVRTGALKQSIAMKVKANKKTGRLYAGAGLDHNTVLYDIKTKKRIRPANYGHLPDLGHVIRGKSKKNILGNKQKGTGAVIGTVPAKPFMRPAINETVGNDLGLEIMVEDIQKSIERAAKRAAKGGKR